MKNLAALALMLVLFHAAARGEAAAAAGPEEVLDAPGGRSIAILLPGASRTTVEVREGYARIRVEGWIRLPGTPSVMNPPAPPAAPPPADSAPACALCGSVSATLASGEIRYGAGARVALLGSVENLEPAWTELRESFDKETAELDARILSLRDQEKNALASTDNLTQATRNLDRARSSLRKAQGERQEIRERYAKRADDLFRAHQAAEVAADAAGSYSFSFLPPGKYYLLAVLTTGEGVRRWYLPVEVGPQGGARMDLRSDTTGPDPYFGAR